MPKLINNHKNSIINHKIHTLVENAMKHKFTNQIDFANYLGVTQATVSRYLNGNTVPSLPILKKIANILNVDLDLLSNNETTITESGIFKLPFYQSEHTAGKSLSSLQAGQDIFNYINMDQFWLKEEFMLNSLDENIFAFRVRDDAMEPIIAENDILMAKKHTPQSNYHGIYLVNYNEQYLVKKIQFKDRYLIKLISNNSDYDSLEINLNQNNITFNILARILARINIKKFTLIGN